MIIRVLGAISGSDFEGEIRAAARAAQELVQRYAIEEAELGEAAAQKEEAFGRTVSFGIGARLLPWESLLAKAITTAVGTVHWYYEEGHFLKEPNGIAKAVVHIWFYGPADDAALAAEMFIDMSLTIVTMAMLKWTGITGSGADYCIGFAQALSAEAYNRGTPKSVEKSMGVTTELALRSRAIMQGKRRRAKTWLATECGVQLARGRRTGGVPIAGFDVEAYQEGQTDGRAHGLSVGRTPKLGGQRALPTRKVKDY